jgi:TolB protein
MKLLADPQASERRNDEGRSSPVPRPAISRFFSSFIHHPASLIFFAFCVALAGPARAQIDIGPVYTLGERSVPAIAVPPFELGEGSGPLADAELFSRVISNDLALSGYFGPPRNAQFARETHLLDLQRPMPNFAEWHRIGVSYLVRGIYRVSGTELRVTVRAYDVVSANYIFGREYTEYAVADARVLAHRISDDIFRQLTGEEGFANTRILFVRQNDPYGRSKQICLMDADGFGVQALTAEGELTATPAWGANGTEVYYTTYRDHNPDLAGMILQGRQPWWVSRRTGLNISPAWSEARRLIALTFTLTTDNTREIYTIARDGTQPRRLTNNRAIDSSPCWNRDGSQIVFQSDRGGSPQLYILDVATLDARRLTYQGNYNDAPVWSPGGPDVIAFHSRINGNFQICTINPDGTGFRQLTSEGSNEDPTWAPNGRVLAYTSRRSSSDAPRIHTLFAADGKIIGQLTSGAASQSSAWSPKIQ